MVDDEGLPRGGRAAEPIQDLAFDDLVDAELGDIKTPDLAGDAELALGSDIHWLAPTEPLPAISPEGTARSIEALLIAFLLDIEPSSWTVEPLRDDAPAHADDEPTQPERPRRR